MKKLFVFIFALLFLICTGFGAQADEPSIKVLTFQIYGSGYASDSDHSGTTIPAGAGSVSWSGSAGASKFFTYVANGTIANTVDNRTIDIKDWAPNGIEKATMVVRAGIPIGGETGVTSVACKDNAFTIIALGAPTLSSVVSAANGVSSYTLLDSPLSGASRIVLYQAGSGVTLIPFDVTTALTTSSMRYYRFAFAGTTTTCVPQGGTSQWPGSTAGTAWASEKGPRMWLTIVPKR